MEKLTQTLRRAFAAAFPGCTPELKAIRPLSKVGGFLIWDGFEGREQIDRQRAVSRVVREALPTDQQSQVTTILTLTPDEAEAMRAEHPQV